MEATIKSVLKRGLIVSCQAQEDEALYGSGMMARMALAAEMGGAEGLRVNGIEHIPNNPF